MKRPKVAHTPGPWKVFGTTDVGTADGENLVAACRAFNPGIPDREAKANAELIASAPAMLSALEIISSEPMEGYEREGDYITAWAKMRRIALDALKKAKGESSG